MTVEFDHLFICASAGGAEADLLAAFGLAEGGPNTHPGQGTACRRFFFGNCYLELLWVCNASEARSETTRPTQLYERWENRAAGACPFGLGFRPRIPNEDRAPFTSWEYRPSYLPPGTSIHIAANTNVQTEPMLFYLPFARRPDSYPPAKQQPSRHSAGLHEVTSITVSGPYGDDPSPAMSAAAASGVVQFRVRPDYLVEIGFDHESRGQQADFRPLLPLAFRW